MYYRQSMFLMGLDRAKRRAYSGYTDILRQIPTAVSAILTDDSNGPLTYIVSVLVCCDSFCRRSSQHSLRLIMLPHHRHGKLINQFFCKILATIVS